MRTLHKLIFLIWKPFITIRTFTNKTFLKSLHLLYFEYTLAKEECCVQIYFKIFFRMHKINIKNIVFIFRNLY